MSEISIKAYVEALRDKHGSWEAASAALGIARNRLWEISKGDFKNIREATLVKLGLRQSFYIVEDKRGGPSERRTNRRVSRPNKKPAPEFRPLENAWRDP